MIGDEVSPLIVKPSRIRSAILFMFCSVTLRKIDEA
jgi:hypothetical protein